MTVRLTDTNLLIRFFTGDDPEKAERVRQLLERVERNRERIALSPIVVFETVFTLQHSYRMERARIKEMLEDLISLPSVHLPNKRVYFDALELYAAHPRLSFGDAYNASYMAASNLTEIYSYDADFDHLPNITRVEP